jgi:hypothetical protein
LFLEVSFPHSASIIKILRPYVHVTVEHPNQIDTVCQRQVKKDVIAHWKTPKARRKLGAFAARHRLFAEHPQCPFESIEHPIRRGFIIVGYEIPNLDQVETYLRPTK